MWVRGSWIGLRGYGNPFYFLTLSAYGEGELGKGEEKGGQKGGKGKGKGDGLRIEADYV